MLTHQEENIPAVFTLFFSGHPLPCSLGINQRLSHAASWPSEPYEIYRRSLLQWLRNMAKSHKLSGVGRPTKNSSAYSGKSKTPGRNLFDGSVLQVQCMLVLRQGRATLVMPLFTPFIVDALFHFFFAVNCHKDFLYPEHSDYRE